MPNITAPLSMTTKQLNNFWARVEKSSDCWLWTGAKTGYGYARLVLDGRCREGHRISYELVPAHAAPLHSVAVVHRTATHHPAYG